MPPANPWMNFDWKRRPRSSGKVWASSAAPIRRVGRPNTTKAMKMPTRMLATVSQSRPIPKSAATPPNPTMAEVEMKVEP